MIKKALLTCLLLLFAPCVSHATAQTADPPLCKHFSGSCGDTDDDLKISISDAVYLINFIFSGGPVPTNYWAGDCDLSGIVNISDAVYLINYILDSGPMPCAGGSGRALESPFFDCLEYTYDGVGTIHFRHVNTSFNCCPGDITIEAFESGQTIHIYEDEIPNPAGACWCMCLFDLEVDLEGIVAGEYRIIVHEPNIFPGEPWLDFTVDFTPGVSGSYCVFRDTYPWGNPW